MSDTKYEVICEVEIGPDSSPEADSLAILLSRTGGVMQVRNDDAFALFGKRIRVSVPAGTSARGIYEDNGIAGLVELVD